MILDDKNIKFLALTLCGDNQLLPYKKGAELVELFNKYGFQDEYGEGFPSRWQYTEENLRAINGTQILKKVIESTIDPRDFIHQEEALEETVEIINEHLYYDGYQLKRIGKQFCIAKCDDGVIIQPQTVRSLSHEFIQEQIKKCNHKIEIEDFNGAITNARSLMEAVMLEIIEKHEGSEPKNDGKLDNLYKQVKKILKLSADKDSFPATVIQILSGLDSIVTGIAGLSNNAGDRHANKFRTQRHHAKLAVNSTMTFVEFLLDSRLYQKKRATTQT